MPSDLLRAIQHASRVLSWQVDLTNDEMPPVWMWPYETALEAWFDEILRLRKDKYSGEDGDSEAPMIKNELAEGRG